MEVPEFNSLHQVMNVSNPESDNTGDRILVVDDLIDNSFLLQTMLEEVGYQVEVADSGHAALTKVGENPPDLILLDVMMPEMSGYEVTQRIRQNPQLPPIPILLVTGYTQINTEAALECGANGLLHKPIDFNEVIYWVNRVLTETGIDGKLSETRPSREDRSASPLILNRQVTNHQLNRQFQDLTSSARQHS